MKAYSKVNTFNWMLLCSKGMLIKSNNKDIYIIIKTN